jgi:ribonuclease HII
MRPPKKSNLNWEKRYWRLGFELVVGVDEAGRGPLAGPVSAGAVALLDFAANDPEIRQLLNAVRDSKKMSARRRDEAYGLLMDCKKIVWANALVSERTIDRVNILEATKMAMVRAIKLLFEKIGTDLAVERVHCLLDGNFSIAVPYSQRSIVAGDARVFSISAASIIAKVVRDRYMEALDKKFPGYDFSQNKGYPTAAHYSALRNLGPCAAHRKTFAPVAALSGGLACCS